jgi:hypothetical protein
MQGHWLGRWVGRWLGDLGGAAPSPTYVYAALVVAGVGSAHLTATGGATVPTGLIGYLWLARARRRR